MGYLTILTVLVVAKLLILITWYYMYYLETDLTAMAILGMFFKINQYFKAFLMGGMMFCTLISKRGEG